MTTSPQPDLERPLVSRAELGDIAWQVLVHDGDVVPLTDDVGLPAAVPATPALRAAALSPLVPPRCVVALGSAAWVHLGGRAPRRVHVVARQGVRARAAGGRSTGEHDLRDQDVALVGGVPVTTPRRTAFDLLTRLPPDRGAPPVRAMERAGLLDLGQVRADVAAASGRRGVVAATRLLDDLTRPPSPGSRPGPAAEVGGPGRGRAA